VICRGAGPEGNVGPDHPDERAAAYAGELPQVLVHTRSVRERIAIGLDTATANDHDRIRAELRDRVVLSGFAERDESEVHAFRAGDPEVGTCGAPRLLAGGTSELVLRLHPTRPATELVGPAVLSLGDQRLTAYDYVLERSHRRKLSAHWLALCEERQIKTGFHADEA
jgi:hypothetical protein